VSADAVRRAVAPRLNGDFYELDLLGVKAAVEALPWVARARVERAWPAQVRVHVREHRAVARWGEAALLSDENRVFTPVAIDAGLAGLPRLAGPDGQQSQVRAAFDALRSTLAGTPFVPERLAQNARGEWTAVTADGIELRLGRGAPADAAALLAGPVQTALAGRLTEVTYVDLHYFNGFAVGWRQRADGAGGAGARPEGRHD
jgi:cell division protein FtsQ